VTPPRDRRSSYDDVLAHVAHKRRKRRSRTRRGSRRSMMATLGLVAMVAFFAVIASGAVAGAVFVDDTLSGVSLDTLKADPPGINSQIYDRDGNLLETISSTENRTPVPSDQISPWLKRATVDIEDKRFYDHGGLDFQGIVRAMVDNLQAGSIQQGASTLEQQLVRNLYLSNEQSWTRKIREAYLATQMADQWSKDKILTEYLNVVPYGAVTYGCEAAALRYFSRRCAKLTIAQAALIAGLPQNPITYNPISNRKAAKARRNEVLAAMLSQGDVTPAQYDHAVSLPLGTKPGSYLDRTGGDQGYFVAWVRQTLEEKLGRNTVRKGGLAIHTTLDPKLQDAAHQILTDTMSWTDAPAAALVSIDPRNGQVLAMDASVPYSKNAQFNIPAEAYRQVGSTFKMFTLTTAIRDGYNPATTSELSAHLSYLFPNTAVGPDNPWVVDTASDSEETGSLRTLVDATAFSDNTVFARLAIDLGAKSIVDTAHRMGIPRSIELAPYPSITLGVSPVSPLWMTAAYSTLAANGVRHDPQFVTKIDSIADGKTVETYRSKGRRVLSDGVAYEANKVLEGPIRTPGGTASATAQFSDGRVESGKTGTTNDYKDAWFCGYTPNLTTCVWVGFKQGEISLDGKLNGHAPYGGDLPATMWREFMEQAFALEPKVFPPVYDWPLPKHPVQWIPFHSQFPTYVPCGTVTPTTGASGGATVTTTGACPTTSNSGSSSGGGSGGGTSKGNGNGNGGGSGGPPTT
jgi:membrane peptidoglycan carboxypeptidase